MDPRARPEAIDTRLVFRAYAWIAIISGVLICAWPMIYNSVDEARMMGVLRAGAAGYVRKDAEPETLLAAVRAVARAERTSTRRSAGRCSREARPPTT